ncbi:unnamed protein product, partial [Amoebophrya sp. A120]
PVLGQSGYTSVKSSNVAASRKEKVRHTSGVRRVLVREERNYAFPITLVTHGIRDGRSRSTNTQRGFPSEFPHRKVRRRQIRAPSSQKKRTKIAKKSTADAHSKFLGPVA